VSPLLRCESTEVTDCGPPGEASEVDDLDRALIDNPVPGLPVAMRGYDNHRLRLVPCENFSQPSGDLRLDPVWLIKPAQRFRHRYGVPIGVNAFGLIMKQPSKSSRLAIGVRSELGVGPLYQRPLEVSNDEKVRVPVLVEQGGGVSGACQAVGETLVGSDLSSDVVIVRASSFDHDPSAFGVDIENGCVDEIPAHVAAKTSIGKPAGDVRCLQIAEPPSMP